jgi:phage/plasmid-like protein (TIGR03299 family)
LFFDVKFIILYVDETINRQDENLAEKERSSTMSHNVESMFYTREKPWHGLGLSVESAPTSADALRMAGLDWDVTTAPVVVGGQELPNYRATVRPSARMLNLEDGTEIVDDDGNLCYHEPAVLGIVSDRYQIIQNAEAFAFTDSLVGGGDVTYETAGSLRDGRLVWMLAKLPQTKILDDEVEPYICFTNSHDGSSAIRVCCTPVRVVCNNTLNLALSSAKRSWATRHTGDLKNKMEEAKYTLGLATRYVEELKDTAGKLANMTISDNDYKDFVRELFPEPTETENAKSNGRRQKNAVYLWNLFNFAYIQSDIAKFRGTGWGLINAASDMVYHGEPLRQTENYVANRWEKSINGNAILDKAMSILNV